MFQRNREVALVLILSFVLFVLFPQLPLNWIGVLTVVAVFGWLMFAVWSITPVQRWIKQQISPSREGGDDGDYAEDSTGVHPRDDSDS